MEHPNSNCEEAKEALLKHVNELEDQAEDRELRSHSETMHHFHITGTSCDTIISICEKHDVDILFHIQLSTRYTNMADGST